MSEYVGVELSDHLSSFTPKPKPKGWRAKARKRRKVSRESRRRNR